MWKRFLLLFFVFGLSASCFGASVNWNASIVDAEHGAPDGYRVYYGYAADQLTTTYDVGTALNFPIPETWNPATYYFGVRAYNASGESGWATTPEGQTWVSYVKSEPPPAPATDVQIVWERLMADTTLYTNALAVYDFENNANDTKGSYNLTAVSTPSYSTSGEAQGTYWAGQLDGSADYFYYQGDTFGFTGNFSVSCWVQFSSITDYYTSFLGYHYNDAGNGWYYALNNSGNPVLRLRNSYVNTDFTFSSVTLSTGTRYHIVFRFDVDNNLLYLSVSTTTFGNIYNGSISVTTNPSAGGSTGRLEVGRRGQDDSYLYGYIDEVVIWQSVISATDAEAIFNARDGGTSWRESGGGASAVPKIMLLQDHFSGGIY